LGIFEPGHLFEPGEGIFEFLLRLFLLIARGGALFPEKIAFVYAELFVRRINDIAAGAQ
jgi:hypothetical protein